MKKLITTAIVAILLAGCGDKGAPEVKDVNNIVVDGKVFTPSEYLKEFCGKKDSPTDGNCLKVDSKRTSDMAKVKKVQW